MVGTLIVKLKTGLNRLWNIVAPISLSQEEIIEDFDELGTSGVFDGGKTGSFAVKYEKSGKPNISLN